MRQYTGQRQPLAASIKGAPATSVIVGLNILFFFGVMFTGGATTQNLVDWGAKYGPFIADGEVWRLAVPMFLHAGFFHLLTNLFGLLIFGSMVEQTFGTRNFVALYVVAGIMGNVVSYVAGPNPGVGASGAVFGVVGAFGMYLLLNRRLLGQVGSQQLTTIGVIVALNIVFGLATTGIDNAAHFGGLLAGGLMAYMMGPRERLVEVSTPFNFGPPRMALRTRQQSATRMAIAVAIVLAAAAVLTVLESQTYVTNIFGDKIPG
ncbi:MAG: rhomboid family intramembrane serine protease [Chloroflexi bacterium]|nr:rhomboid family intramembrane serine protease [Chloroflexota bacterium]